MEARGGRSIVAPPRALDVDRLHALADAHAAAFRDATPFPHTVLDDVFPDALLADVLAEFPEPDDAGWVFVGGPTQHKQQWADSTRLPAAAASFVALLQSAPFVSFLERLTGFTGLVGDPHCYHGGLHQSSTGGFLKVHADQLVQPRLGLHRRVDVIVYLNRDWDPAWGGELELWDAAMTACVTRVVPCFNRMVVFDAVGTNHGHPDPLATPPDRHRRSVALYYYTAPRADVVDGGRPVVRARPGEDLGPRKLTGVRKLAVDVLPPVVTRRLARGANGGRSA